MKKILLVNLVFLFIFLLVGCAPTDSAASSSEYKKLVVGLDENFPPMGFRDKDGNVVGFDIDLAKEVGKRMGIEMVFQPIDWDSKELELQSKKVDLLWNGVTITPEREKVMLFTKPYLNNKQIILAIKDSSINSKADLAGKTIGLQKNSSAVDAVNKDEETSKAIKEIVQYSDNILAFKDLEIGRVEAVVVDEIAARYYLEQNETNFRILDDDFGSEVYGVAMRPDDTALKDTLQKALDDMNSDGTSAKISQTWFGEDIIVK